MYFEFNMLECFPIEIHVFQTVKGFVFCKWHNVSSKLPNTVYCTKIMLHTMYNHIVVFLINCYSGKQLCNSCTS